MRRKQVASKVKWVRRSTKDFNLESDDAENVKLRKPGDPWRRGKRLGRQWRMSMDEKCAATALRKIRKRRLQKDRKKMTREDEFLSGFRSNSVLLLSFSSSGYNVGVATFHLLR
ncbi:hypothetical protein PIB30_040385 [Stylosanthes scabra]|uniref:Uncharacterized protein n=1 Tax=Stylosanthes scabra TaxID=79078 RepID=A0ABU6ZD97_9FABA|nr:hypothetical protein [Stylosanthes scabra]